MTLDEKRRRAIAYLGQKWVLHPANFQPRGDYEHPVQKVNLWDTFARLKEQPLIKVGE